MQTNPLGGITRYGYDVQDRLTTITDPNGNATSYVYDGLGNLTGQHSPTPAPPPTPTMPPAMC